MNTQEFKRLTDLGRAYKKSRQQRSRVVSKRSARNQGSGTGMILLRSRIIPGVGLEKQFLTM